MCQYLLIRNRCICSCRRCRGGQYSRRWQSKGGGPLPALVVRGGARVGCFRNSAQDRKYFSISKKNIMHIYISIQSESTLHRLRAGGRCWAEPWPVRVGSFLFKCKNTDVIWSSPTARCLWYDVTPPPPSPSNMFFCQNAALLFLFWIAKPGQAR